jgi:hypothetical protein
MRRAYGLLPWGMIALGVLHMAASWRFYNTLTASALWFFSAGIAWLLIGSLNLLNHAYGAIAPGLKWFCRGINVVMLCFTALSGVVTNASASGMAIVVGLFGAVTVLSWMRAAVGNARLRSNEEL